MKKKAPFIGLPGSTVVDLVGFKGKKRTILKGIALDEANEKIRILKKDEKWKDWRFQTYQEGFVK